MKRKKKFCLNIVFMLILFVLTGCGNKSEIDGRTNLFGKYEIFNDADLELFQNEALKVTINGNTYTLGMTKSEIESMLGETGEGYASECYNTNSRSCASYVVEPESYKYYTSVKNYYYYPKNKIAIIYYSLYDGKETNNPAVLISVNDPSFVDSEGFSPQRDMWDDVKTYIIDKYGERLSDDLLRGFADLHYNEFGEIVVGKDWPNYGDKPKPGGWKSYYAYDGEEIDSITVGCRISSSEDREILQLWE